MRFMTAFQTPAFVLLFAVLASSQTTWYVDQASTAFPLGTHSNPFHTLQHALGTAIGGDIILVSPGTYYLLSMAQTPAFGQTVELIALAGQGLTQVVVSSLSISGPVSFRGFDLSGMTTSSVLVAYGPTMFVNCRFQSPFVAVGEFASATFDRCEFVFQAGPIQVFGSASFLGCVFRGSPGGSLDIRDAGLATVSSSVFYASATASIFVRTSSTVLVENSTIWNSAPILETGGPPIFFEVFNSNVPNAALYGNGCFTADPLFVDAPNGDFHLMPGSPCINAGTNSALFIPATDIDGEARIQDGVIDIGVDEADASLVVLGPCGAGNVGVGQGGPFNLLKINNSSGGIGRRVDVPVGQSITISMDQPITNPFAAPFIIYGLIGAPVASDATVLPSSLGTMCFPPSPLVPGYPLLFTLANSVSFDPSALVPAIPAPWSVSDSNGLSFPFQITFQGVIFQDPATVRVTNGVILNVQ